MRKNRLLIALGALAVLIGVTVWAALSEQSDDEVSEQATLPKISRDKLDTIEIHRPKEQAIKLAKNGDNWRVIAPVNAEADQGAIDTAIEKLTELAVTGIAATKKDNYDKLDVDADSGIRVVAKNAGKTLADLIIGAGRGGNTMVRQEGKTPVLSVAGSIRWMFDRELKDWRQRKVVDVENDQIVEIQFESPNGNLRFERVKGQWEQAKGSKAIAKFDPSKVESYVSSVSHLTATDFAEKGASAESAGLGNNAKTVVRFSVKPKSEGKENESQENQQVVIRIGSALENDENRYYFQRDGNPIIYTTTKYLADRLAPKTEDFAKSEEKDEAGDMPEGMPQGMPPGMGMPAGAAGPGGGGQLPPEVMEKIQQQLKNQQP